MNQLAVPVLIDKQRDLDKAQDYAYLREQGLSYIRELSGKIWTDHNLHDPGITNLEVLCYALTDLGYRTGFDIKDLLVKDETGDHDPPSTSGLFPAHEVLPNAPLTIQDYRRLLLKIEGIRNAWLDPMKDPDHRESEVPIFADCLGGRLTEKPLNAAGEPSVRVRISGLYKVFLELEIDDALGSLNETQLTYRVRRGVLKGVVFSLDSEDPGFREGQLDFDPNFAHVVQVGPIAQGPNSATFSTLVQIELSDGTTPTLQLLALRLVDPKPKPNEPAIPIKIPDQVLELQALLAEELEDSLLPLFWRKQQARKRSLDAVCCVLDAHRNLCEDFLSIETVTAERVAVCADLELTSNADIEDVQARAYHAIEQYLNPPVRYFTLQELMDEGLCPDEIFNGPYVDYRFKCGENEIFTKPGFIKPEDLAASELREVVYVSDIINILMDFEEIIAVRNVQLRKYDAAGIAVGASEKWCLAITPNHQPILDTERSKILFFKGGIPYAARDTEARQTLDHLRAMARKAAYVEPNQILDPPRGRYRRLEQHFSVQHDYPLTYGIGVAGLPANADPGRISQARQLKAYLTFYDQLLADYLAQLANIRRFFSVEKSVKQTYYTQYLEDFDDQNRTGIAGVLTDFPGEFYAAAPGLPDLSDEMQRVRLTENEEIFFDRRNRLLDHLTARFAEQFTDYVLMMFRLSGDPLHTQKELIDDKIDFLSEYPVLSRDRNRAFNYRPQKQADIWNTDNVSGLKKRVSRLAGIDSYLRRNLACTALFDVLFSTRKVGGQYRLEIKNRGNQVLFKSVQLFATVDDSLAAGRKIFPVLRRESAYEVDDSGVVGQVFYAIKGVGITIRHHEFFDTEADAVRSIRDVIDRYDEALHDTAACDEEGFHLFEHILLRPLLPGAVDPALDAEDFMDVCLAPDCELCGEEDPYSFRITAVLPYWPERFRDLHFRRFFERLLRQETPAHIHARICWVGNDQMILLDRAYRLWLHAKSKKDVDASHLRRKRRALIAVLQRLKTVYPPAELHDCLEGEDENLVRLDSTNLGIF